MIQLSIGDIDTLLDALRRGAARHESLAADRRKASGSRFIAKHDRAAEAMRELHIRLLRVKAENRGRQIRIGCHD